MYSHAYYVCVLCSVYTHMHVSTCLCIHIIYVCIYVCMYANSNCIYNIHISRCMNVYVCVRACYWDKTIELYTYTLMHIYYVLSLWIKQLNRDFLNFASLYFIYLKNSMSLLNHITISPSSTSLFTTSTQFLLCQIQLSA